MPLPIPPATRRRLLAVSLLAFCAVCAAYPQPWHQRARHAAHAAAWPGLAALGSLHDTLRELADTATTLWAATQEVERLREENRALRETLARLTDHAHQQERRLRDFEQLKDFRLSAPDPAREFRDYSLQHPVRILPASVVAVDASPWRHTVIVNRGAADGVTEGVAAVWGSSVVGTVVALRASAATVRLLTDARSGLTARIARSGDVGLLSGNAEQAAILALKWIHLHPVQEGDLVVTSGTDPNIPPGLVAGQVVRASETRTPLFFDIVVRPLLDLDRLTELLLIVPTPGEAEELLEQERRGAPETTPVPGPPHP